MILYFRAARLLMMGGFYAVQDNETNLAKAYK